MPFQHRYADLHGRKGKTVTAVEPLHNAVVAENERNLAIQTGASHLIEARPGYGVGSDIFHKRAKHD